MEDKIKKIRQDSISVITDFMLWNDEDFNFKDGIECGNDTIISMFLVSNEIMFWGEDDVYSFKELPLDTLLAITEEIHKHILKTD